MRSSKPIRARDPLSGDRHSQLIGLASRPSSQTMKCRWQPVEYPVEPT